MLAEEMPERAVRPGEEHPRVAGARPSASTAVAAEFALELLETCRAGRRRPVPAS